MEQQILLGSLDSGEGLKLTVAIRIQDEFGEGATVAKDLMDMLTTYVNDMHDGGAEQFAPDDNDFLTQLRINLGLEV